MRRKAHVRFLGGGRVVRLSCYPTGSVLGRSSAMVTLSSPARRSPLERLAAPPALWGRPPPRPLVGTADAPAPTAASCPRRRLRSPLRRAALVMNCPRNVYRTGSGFACRGARRFGPFFFPGQGGTSHPRKGVGR